MLPFLCERWSGPISIAVLAEEEEVRDEVAAAFFGAFVGRVHARMSDSSAIRRGDA